MSNHCKRTAWMHTRAVRTLCAALALSTAWLVGGPALALTPVAPAASATEALRQDPAAIQRREAEVRKRLRMPTEQEIGAQRGGMVTLPRQADSGPSIDLEAIARQYDSRSGMPKADGGDAATREPVAGLLVFVSLGMPEPSLKRLIDDAKRFRATLVLQGFKDKSLMATTSAIQRLQGDGVSLPWRVDPRLFDAFKVQTVPVHLLIDPAQPLQGGCPAQECLAAARFSRVAGDVSMEYALRAMAAEDRPLSALAERLLAMTDDGQWYRQRSQP